MFFVIFSLTFIFVHPQSLRDMVGLPVGVQVIGLPFRDEITLRAMKELETALKQ